MKPAIRSVLVIIAALIMGGCTTPKYTQPDRTGIEQLLLSTAIDRALEGIEMPQLAGKRVFVRSDFLQPYDAHYAEAAVRALVSENGALLVRSIENAEIVVEPRDGALGIDPAETFFGVPSVAVPVPASGTLATPELALYASRKQNAVTKLAILAYELDGTNVFSSPAYEGKSYFHNYSVLLFIDINFTDIPERENY